ncbi:HAD hydrolase family protein [Pelagicoccus sp. SDUM812003]|uniref:KdsC family phosphatase n=1 Tax=Pelagicoccus sp. SDUM812003 TaxID=3041267 RepID=UPI00280D892E|nr:HAD hydrolase family protein [Pelagicoccus sp. SDUM812003]MDQ8203879.1 HAD hydrolase family protein [Pelagicoccus sp. SDUM812003]
MPSNPAHHAPLDWASIKVFAMDVDGILTDGAIYVSSDGSEAKRFSIVDGLGLARLRQAGIILAWISGRMSDATTVRAKELKIPHLVQGKLDKLTGLKDLLEELQLEPHQAVYMGDDVIDVDAIRYAGIGVTVPEAQQEALAAADYITSRPGGHGAVREVCNHIYHAMNR